MTSHDDDPPTEGVRNGYDVLAERANDDPGGWDSPWGDNPLQKYYSWPATRSLLPDVTDRRVLDAGCGIGDHVEWLLDGGATVVGVDASEGAIETARERFGDRATFYRADLSDRLDFASDDAFDVVLSHLVLDHIAEWEPVLEEFRRVLTDRGSLVFTIVHPMQYYLEYEAVTSYYDMTPVEITWPDAPVTSYHRPLSEVIGSLTSAGFHVDVIEEPRPPEAYVEHAPERWDVTERPQILCGRASVASCS